MALAAPFARRGHSVDLAASDRIARRLAFRESAPADAPALRQRLWLDDAPGGGHRLVRSVTLPSGAVSELQAAGDDPAALLASVEAVPLQAQWRCAPDHELAISLRLDGARAGSPPADAAPRPSISRIEARIEGLVMRLKLSAVPGIPAELEIDGAGSDLADLPDDLLAVLGSAWSSLWRVGDGWRGSFRPPRREPARSEQTLRQIEAAALHLARTLREPPARFHERLAAARWRVAARRCVPLLSALALIGASFAVVQLDLAANSVWRMVIFNAPPILLAAGVCLKELPRFELPRLPRASSAAAWRRAPVTPAAPTTTTTTTATA